MEGPERWKPYRKEIITIAGCAALLLLCAALYIADNPIEKWYEWTAVLTELLLFCAVGVRFVFRWFDDWKQARRELPEPAPEPVKIRTDLTVFCCMLGVHAIRILLGYVWQVLALDFHGSLLESLSVWWGSDTGHYLEIAEYWYADYNGSGTVWRLVFFPFYPILIRLLQPLIGEWFHAGMLISILCSSAAGCVLYRLVRLDHDEETARRAVKYYAILPAAFFYTAVLSEGTFLLLSLLCVLFSRKRRWLAAAVFGMLAAFTRSLGIVLLVPAFYEWMTALIGLPNGKRKKTLLWGLCLLLIPLGFCAYLWINYRETGDCFAFLAYQKENWNQQLGWFFHSARYQSEYLVRWLHEGRAADALGLWIPSLCARFLALTGMCLTAKAQRPADTAYFLIYYLIAMGTTWLLSAPRYLLVLYPIVLALAHLGRRRRLDATVTAACLIGGQLYFYAFLMQFDVY